MAGPVLGNGKQYSWGSGILGLAQGQIEIEGYSEITWSQKRTRSKGRGQGRHQAPQVRSNGEYECDNVKIKMRVDHADAVRAGMAAMSNTGTSYGNARIPITYQLVEEEGISTLQFFDCAIANESGTYSTGPDGLLEEVEFDVMAARKNGLALFDDSDPNTPY